MKNAIVLLLAASCVTNPSMPAPAPVENPQAAGAGPAKAVGPTKAPAQVSTPDAEFRAQPPGPSASTEFHAPAPNVLKLSNGLPVFLVERHDLPLVAMALAFKSGADTATRAKAGLPSMVLDLLDEGTPSKDAAAIARGFEDLAAQYHTQADADASTVSFSALSGTFEPTLELFADVVLHPAFRKPDVERVQKQRLGQIAQTLDDPQAIGQHVLSRVIFGEKHPWAFPAEGTVDSIKALTATDLAAWHKAHFQPSNAAMFVVGDVTEAALKAALEKRFAGWKNSGAQKPPKNTAPRSSERVVTLVDKPDAPQSQIWIGEVGVSSMAPDVFPVRVMNNILGGSFNSRLNGNLRTEHAYSYGVFSFYDAHREAGPFVAAGGVVADKTAEALGEFMKELTRMKTGEISDAELADAKDGLVRTIPSLFASNEATSQALARAWSHGLPADYYSRYQQRVLAVTKEDVAKAARERLHPDNMSIVVVGPGKIIEEKLVGLKYGRIELRDANGEAVKAARAAAGK